MLKYWKVIIVVVLVLSVILSVVLYYGNEDTDEAANDFLKSTKDVRKSIGDDIIQIQKETDTLKKLQKEYINIKNNK